MIEGEDLTNFIEDFRRKEMEARMQRKAAYIDKVRIEEYQYGNLEEPEYSWDYSMRVSLDVKTLDDCVALRQAIIDAVDRFNEERGD